MSGSKQGFTEIEVGGQWVKNAVIGCVAEAKTSWVVLGSLVLVFVQLLIKNHFLLSKRKLKLPPGPRNWPLVGAIFSMESNLLDSFSKLGRKFGPIFYYRFGSYGVIVVSSVEGAKEVLTTKDFQFADRPNNTLLRTASKFLAFDSQNVLFASYNEHLKTLKKACRTELFLASKLAACENVRQHEGAAMVEDISNQHPVQNGGGISGQGRTVKIREPVKVMSTNILCMMLFGKRYSDAILSETDEFRQFPDLVKQFLELLKFHLTDIFPWLDGLDPEGLGVHFKEFQQRSRKCYGQILEEHRAVRKRIRNYQDKDFVDLLLTLHESGKITEEAIFGCLMDMIAGGMENTATTTEWALVELVKNPGSLARLQKEIDEVVGSDRPVEESDFARMPYLQAVMKETFRLHSPSPLFAPHFTKSETSLGGFYVPANTAVFVNMYAIGRDPLLGENPEQFNPERFFGPRHSDVLNVTGSTYQILPFGSGRRMCPGYNLALPMFQRALTTLVHAFDWSPPPGLGVDDISARERMAILVTLEVPLVLSATPRLAPDVYTTTRLGPSRCI